MLYILTGNGKGKTTSALGMGLRAVGGGKKVLMVQFLKGGSSSELKAIKKLKNFKVRSFGRKVFVLPKRKLENHPELKKAGVQPLSQEDFLLAGRAFEFAKKELKRGAFDVVILDEIFIALKFKLLKEREVYDFLEKFASDKNIDIVLTGRYCPRKFFDLASVVSEIRARKHYYSSIKDKRKSKKGIEF
jgi:cob(I)alamin adenosyltransferase